MSGRGLQNPWNYRAEVARKSWKFNRWVMLFLLIVLTIAGIIKSIEFLSGLFS